MRRIILFTALLTLFCSTIQATPQQSRKSPAELQRLIQYTTELEFQAVLTEYVYDQYLQYGEGKIAEEKYLISLMELVNREVSRRLTNPKEARHKYFQSLNTMLKESQNLENRLRAAGIRDLDAFIDDLQERIKFTIDREEIDFRKKKVFEDALQMLYISEEMIRMDRDGGVGDISRQIRKTKAEILSAFGEVSGDGEILTGSPPTIYDLFVEWKRNDQITYQLRLADVMLARRNLFKSAGIDQILQMFNDELNLAYSQFNLGDYELAETLLADLLESYPRWGVQNLDDVAYYYAECAFAQGQLLHARDRYRSLIDQYPGTGFLTPVYSRLTQINYALEDYRQTIEYANLYRNVAPSGSEDYYDVAFFQAMAFYRLNDYSSAVETLSNIPADNPYYHLAQYFIGNAYADSQLLDEAAQAYAGLVQSKATPPYLHARALYKLGILEYERRNYARAVAYLELIQPGFNMYDRVLNALAWAYFEQERSKEAGETQNFAMAAYYAQKLLDEFYASPYKMEASSLLAYIHQLVGEPVEAIGLYRNVYQTKVKRTEIENYLDERRRLENLYWEALSARNKALQANNSQAYVKADALISRLDGEIARLDLSEASPAGLALQNEAASVIRQIRELNRLRLLAEERGNKLAVKRIDSLQTRLGIALESFPAEVLEEAEYTNLFDDYPVSKYIAEEEDMRQQMFNKREEIRLDIQELDRLLVRVDDQISMAKVNQKFSLVNQLERKKLRLQQIRKRYDNLLSAVYQEGEDSPTYPEFNKWADLGAFGIINVYFDQKQQMQNQLVKVADVLGRVNNQLNRRKQVIEDKIKKIEAEVRFMTMKARMEERARLRAERDRAFRESYFDTRESEAPEPEK